MMMMMMLLLEPLLLLLTVRHALHSPANPKKKTSKSKQHTHTTHFFFVATTSKQTRHNTLHGSRTAHAPAVIHRDRRVDFLLLGSRCFICRLLLLCGRLLALAL
jgi:hypothetical protein